MQCRGTGWWQSKTLGATFLTLTQSQTSDSDSIRDSARLRGWVRAGPESLTRTCTQAHDQYREGQARPPRRPGQCRGRGHCQLGSSSSCGRCSCAAHWHSQLTRRAAAWFLPGEHLSAWHSGESLVHLSRGETHVSHVFVDCTFINFECTECWDTHFFGTSIKLFHVLMSFFWWNDSTVVSWRMDNDYKT